MSIGGFLFPVLLPYFTHFHLNGNYGLCTLNSLFFAVAMLIPACTASFENIFVSFLVLEGMVGMFNSSGATLRSSIYPEQQQSSIMSVFRILLNVLVVIGKHTARCHHSLIYCYVVVVADADADDDADEYTNLYNLCLLLFLFIYSSLSISFSFLHYLTIHHHTYRHQNQ